MQAFPVSSRRNSIAHTENTDQRFRLLITAGIRNSGNGKRRGIQQMDGFGQPEILYIFERSLTSLFFENTAEITAVQSYMMRNFFYRKRFCEMIVNIIGRLADIKVPVGFWKNFLVRSGNDTDKTIEITKYCESVCGVAVIMKQHV